MFWPLQGGGGWVGGRLGGRCQGLSPATLHMHAAVGTTQPFSVMFVAVGARCFGRIPSALGRSGGAQALATHAALRKKAPVCGGGVTLGLSAVQRTLRRVSPVCIEQVPEPGALGSGARRNADSRYRAIPNASK